MVLQMTFLSFITIHSWTIYRPVWSCLKEGFKSSMASCRNCINNVLQSAVTTMPVIILNYVWDEEHKSKNHRCIGSMSSSYRLPLMICDHHSVFIHSYIHALIHIFLHLVRVQGQYSGKKHVLGQGKHVISLEFKMNPNCVRRKHTGTWWENRVHSGGCTLPFFFYLSKFCWTSKTIRINYISYSVTHGWGLNTEPSNCKGSTVKNKDFQVAKTLVLGLMTVLYGFEYKPMKWMLAKEIIVSLLKSLLSVCP